MADTSPAVAETPTEDWGPNSEKGIETKGTGFAAAFAVALIFVLCICLAIKRLPVMKMIHDAKATMKKRAYVINARTGEKVHPGVDGP